MSSDSHMFKTKEQLVREGFDPWGNSMIYKSEIWLPMYEAKMIWQYDHRFGTYDGIDSRSSTHLPTPILEVYQDPNYQIIPWYWVASKETYSSIPNAYNLGKWIAYRFSTGPTNERTLVATILPICASNHILPIIFLDSMKKAIILLSNLNSLILDYVLRNKMGRQGLDNFFMKQIPAVNDSLIIYSTKLSIIRLSMELIYTSWDIKSCADELWKEADEELRLLLRTQWEENKAETGGHKWDPPEWCEIDNDGCPLPPFKWDEDRRTVLKAELDAIYAKLYGLTTDELRYILDPQDVYGPDFPGETFRVLKEKEIRNYGEYRTKRLVMEAWEKLNKAEN